MFHYFVRVDMMFAPSALPRLEGGVGGVFLEL